MARVAVVGAGISGLACARILQDRGHNVFVFDKGRGPGGRTSTRREGEWRFDHGAQFFRVRDERFARAAAEWLERGVIALWKPNLARITGGRAAPEPHRGDMFLPQPSMSALAQHLAGGLCVATANEVATISPIGQRWALLDAAGRTLSPIGEEFDALVLTTPPVQTAKLLATSGVTAFEDQLKAAVIAPCWAAMIVTDGLDLAPFDAAHVDGGPLAWIACESRKPLRTSMPDGRLAWVVHATPAWSREHLEKHQVAIAPKLAEAFADALVTAGVARTNISCSSVTAHRWRYALVERPAAVECCWSNEHRLALAGDWCLGGRIEAAYLSGCAAAGRILASAATVA